MLVVFGDRDFGKKSVLKQIIEWPHDGISGFIRRGRETQASMLALSHSEAFWHFIM
jgi:hypothetical protein